MSTRLCETASLELEVQSAVQQILTTMALNPSSNSHSAKKSACIFQNKITYTLYLLLQSFQGESLNTISKQCHYGSNVSFQNFDQISQKLTEVIRQSQHDFAIRAANRRGTLTHITQKETTELVENTFNTECEMVISALSIQQLTSLINVFSTQEDITESLDLVFSRVIVNQDIDEGFQLSKQATYKLVEQISHSITGELCQLILTQHISQQHQEDFEQYLHTVRTLAEHFVSQSYLLNAPFLIDKTDFDNLE